MFLATGCVGHKHSFGDWSNVKEASCKDYGRNIRTCKLCDEIEYQLIQPTGEHSFSLAMNILPTCMSTGFQKKICDVCKFVLNEVIENFGTHSDENADGNCDKCMEKVYRAEVVLNLENNAQASANDFVLISYESGGAIPVTLGENSMIRGGSSLFLPTEDSPGIGNIVRGDITAMLPEQLNSLTAHYIYRVYANRNFGGIPEKVYIDIADTTQTALAVLRVSAPRGTSSFPYVYLFYGKRNDKNDKTAGDNPENFTEIKTPYGDTNQFKVIKFAYPDGEIIGTTPTVNVLLTEEIIFIDLFLQQIGKSA